MGLTFLIVVGGMLGWLAAIITYAEGTMARRRNVLTGVAGALLAGLVVCPLIGGSNLLEGHYGVDALLIALAGAVVVLFAAHLWRHRELG